jgi:hypothetical protein
MALDQSVAYTPHQRERLYSEGSAYKKGLAHLFGNALELHKIIETEPIGNLHGIVHELEEIVYSTEYKQRKLPYPIENFHPLSVALHRALQQQTDIRHTHKFYSDLETIDELTAIIGELRHVLILTYRRGEAVDRNFDEAWNRQVEMGLIKAPRRAIEPRRYI